MIASSVLADPWTARRRRAEALAERYPFAREMLGLYRALLDVQERAWAEARREAPAPSGVAAYAAGRVLPGVVDATLAAGPEPLARLVRDRAGAAAGREELVRAWLTGDEQPSVDRYLARAASAPVLEALGPAAGAACAGPRDDRHCPVCGGMPQLSYTAQSAETLVTARRHLVCARCAAAWTYPRLTCAGCGEHDTRHLSVFAEEGAAEAEATGQVVRGTGDRVRGEGPAGGASSAPRFPHIRIETCSACSRYLLAIDLVRDPEAVPLVDELSATPLDLFAADRGFAKVVPNLMGV